MNVTRLALAILVGFLFPGGFPLTFASQENSTEGSSRCDVPEARQFDFLVGEWDIFNRRRNAQGIWEEFRARLTGSKFLDGCVVIDHYNGTFPSGLRVKGITIRAFDPSTKKWSIVWLDNVQPPDFTPLVGQFREGKGEFLQETMVRGKRTRVRFTWDNITHTTARWAQAFSLAEGEENWHTNWIMEFTRKE